MGPMFFTLTLLFFSFDKLRSDKFDACGKNAGVVVASRGAAVASKYIQKCGKKIMLGYPWTTPIMITVAEKACLGMHLCYTYNEEKKKESATAFRQAIRKCAITLSQIVYTMMPELLGFTAEQYASLMQHFSMCLRGDMLPLEPSVTQAALRHFLKSTGIIG